MSFIVLWVVPLTAAFCYTQWRKKILATIDIYFCTIGSKASSWTDKCVTHSYQDHKNSPTIQLKKKKNSQEYKSYRPYNLSAPHFIGSILLVIHNFSKSKKDYFVVMLVQSYLEQKFVQYVSPSFKILFSFYNCYDFNLDL